MFRQECSSVASIVHGAKHLDESSGISLQDLNTQHSGWPPSPCALILCTNQENLKGSQKHSHQAKDASDQHMVGY